MTCSGQTALESKGHTSNGGLGDISYIALRMCGDVSIFPIFKLTQLIELCRSNGFSPLYPGITRDVRMLRPAPLCCSYQMCLLESGDQRGPAVI